MVTHFTPKRASDCPGRHDLGQLTRKEINRLDEFLAPSALAYVEEKSCTGVRLVGQRYAGEPAEHEVAWLKEVYAF